MGILLLDEATSAVDHHTDQLIQETIRKVFATDTILTIAHRIDTVLDYDKIMIMDTGKILEFDSPNNLLNNDKSLFVDIVQESFGVDVAEVIQSKSYLTDTNIKVDLEKVDLNTNDHLDVEEEMQTVTPEPEDDADDEDAPLVQAYADAGNIAKVDSVEDEEYVKVDTADVNEEEYAE